MMPEPMPMPMPTVKRALELGAGFIEHDLATMREQARRNDEEARDEKRGVYPVTHCLEHDLMKAAEWAAAAATLRMMAREATS